MTRTSPLVSVGIPAYERPDGLARTLECITAQTHELLEIVVSDNASSDPQVREIGERAARDDRRVRYHRQEENRGAVHNINWLLEQATGEYFMWAADDDAWEPSFISRCLEPFLTDDAPAPGDAPAAVASTGLAAVGMEACYTEPGRDGRRYDFFPEGVPFHAFASDDAIERMRFVLRHNYGNLFYSLYRRDALFLDGTSVYRRLELRALNEIPVFLWVARKGNWRVLPDVGLYKSTTPEVYAQARWEKQGGPLPEAGLAAGDGGNERRRSEGRGRSDLGSAGRGSAGHAFPPGRSGHQGHQGHLRHLRWMAGDVRRYHGSALGDILRALRRMGLPRADFMRLAAAASGMMARHYGYYLFRRRSPAFSPEV